MKRLVMEFLGTFFLVLAVVLTGNALAIASTLMAWVYIGGYISGAHYNPAVSLAVAAREFLAWELCVRYWIAQIAGGLSAYALAAYLHQRVVLPHPNPGVTLLQAFIVEVLLAFTLTFVVLVVTTARQFVGSHMFGFAIGFTIPALALVGAPISGGLFNPAISLGSALYGLIRGIPVVWEHVAMYVGGALLGGLIASYAFRYFFLDELDGCASC